MRIPMRAARTVQPHACRKGSRGVGEVCTVKLPGGGAPHRAYHRNSLSVEGAYISKFVSNARLAFVCLGVLSRYVALSGMGGQSSQQRLHLRFLPYPRFRKTVFHSIRLFGACLSNVAFHVDLFHRSARMSAATVACMSCCMLPFSHFLSYAASTTASRF